MIGACCSWDMRLNRQRMLGGGGRLWFSLIDVFKRIFVLQGGRTGAVVSHISRKTSEIPRISCTQPWTRPRVRLSLRKGAWSAWNPLSFTGNRGYRAPRVSGQDRVLQRRDSFTTRLMLQICAV